LMSRQRRRGKREWGGAAQRRTARQQLVRVERVARLVLAWWMLERATDPPRPQVLQGRLLPLGGVGAHLSITSVAAGAAYTAARRAGLPLTIGEVAAAWQLPLEAVAARYRWGRLAAAQCGGGVPNRGVGWGGGEANMPSHCPATRATASTSPYAVPLHAPWAWTLPHSFL
jgi:hypothetical protein